MAVYKRDIVDINLETGNIHRSFLKHSIGYMDQKADHFGVRVYRNGEPVDLTGVSVQGVFMPPQGDPIAITTGNFVDGNEAEVVLPQACYNYDGQFTLAIKLVDVSNSVTGTMRIVDGMVDNTHASGTVAPTEAVPTYQEILAVYDDLLEALDDVADYAENFAPIFAAGTANAAGSYVMYEGDLYLLPNGHEANVTWANTTKTQVNIGSQVSDLKSALNTKEKATFVVNSSQSMFKRKTMGDNGGTAVFTDSTTRILTNPMIDVLDIGSILTITPTSGYKYILYQITADNKYVGGFSSYSWISEERNITIGNTTAKVVLSISKSDNSEIQLADYNKVSCVSIGRVDLLINQVDRLDDRIDDFSDLTGRLINTSDMTFTRQTGGESVDGTFVPASSTTRIMSELVDISTFDVRKIKCDPTSGYKYIVYEFKDSTHLTKAIANFQWNDEASEISFGYLTNYIRFLIAKTGTPSPDIPLTDYDKVSFTEIGIVEENTEDISKLFELVNESDGTDTTENTLYIGSLVQNSLDGNGYISSASNKIVSQKSALCIPYYGVKVTAVMPQGYCVGFKSGTTTLGTDITLTTDSGWLESGDTYTFDYPNKQIYRAYFGKDNGVSDITVQEISELISSGNIRLVFKNDSGDIETRNACNENYIKNIMRMFTGTLSNDDSLTKMPTFTHTSDVHGDAIRTKSFLDYSDFLEVDAAVISGDLVPMSASKDKTDFVDDLIDEHQSMTLLCMGNHDARGLTTKQAQSAVLAHTIDKYELETPSGETYPSYFYTDLADKKIRMISVNQYEAGQYNTNYWRYTQDQINWLIATLAATPQDYGVIIIMHSPEVTISENASYNKFFQDGTFVIYNAIKPVTQIVDAFISKTTYSGSFEQATSGETETITISADFTNLNTGVEFICFMTGHRHKDGIGYSSDTTNMQLMCNVQCGFALYGNSSYHYYAECSDTPRGGKGMTQDAFNVYCIDRTNKQVRVARVGSNMKSGLEMRDYLIIPYAD